MADFQDYKEILLGESLDSDDSSSDWEPTGKTLGSQDSWSEFTDDFSQDSFLVSSQSSENSQKTYKNQRFLVFCFLFTCFSNAAKHTSYKCFPLLSICPFKYACLKSKEYILIS